MGYTRICGLTLLAKTKWASTASSVAATASLLLDGIANAIATADVAVPPTRKFHSHHSIAAVYSLLSAAYKISSASECLTLDSITINRYPQWTQKHFPKRFIGESHYYYLQYIPSCSRITHIRTNFRFPSHACVFVQCKNTTIGVRVVYV